MLNQFQDILLIRQPVYKSNELTSQNILYLTLYCYQISIAELVLLKKSISNIQLIIAFYISYNTKLLIKQNLFEPFK
jgi:hypothetical protein